MDVRGALAAGPWELLTLVSVLAAAIERRPDPMARDAGPTGPSMAELVGTFIEVERPETSALLAGLSLLTGDQLLATRMQRALRDRENLRPGWLADLADVEVYRCVDNTHILGDGDNINLGARLPGGEELTAVVYVDHNMGTLVKDAFVLPGAIEQVLQRYREATDDPDVVIADMSPGDAKAKLAEAIELSDVTWPPFESETWPGCKPLVQWLLRQLPDGGNGYEHREWEEAELAELKQGFLSSSQARALRDPDHASLADALFWFGSGYAGTDPLRWSPVRVEMLLGDWLPRKVMADADYLAKAPVVLRALIRYSHAERGIRRDLTAETLEAVDEHEPAYQEAIRSPRLQGPAGLLARLSWPDVLLASLARAAGSAEALDQLTTDPLSDEAFDWTGIPDDVRETVAEVLAIVDRVCDAGFDVEHRTAARRLLARVASGDPSVFRRKANANHSAAAVCWLVGKANDLFTPLRGGWLVKDFLACFGIKSGSVSQRAMAYLKAAGFVEHTYGDIDLAADLLVSRRRERIIELRDRYRRERAADPS